MGPLPYGQSPPRIFVLPLYRSYFAAMMNLETKDGVLMLILGSMIHFLVIVWYKFKRYEVMLMGALDHAMVWQIGACASSP